MNKIFAATLFATLLSAGTALAETEPCDTQLHAQITTLQAEVAQLQAGSDVQSGAASQYQMPTGG